MSKPSKQILDTVAATLEERGEEYGDSSANFQRIVDGWNALFSQKLSTPLTVGDVARGMAWLKLARLANTPDHFDSYLDIVGYTLLGVDLEIGEEDGTTAH